MIGPIDQTVAGFWIGAAAAENRAEKKFFHVARIFETRRVRLDHLPDFFFERHARKQCVDVCIVISKTPWTTASLRFGNAG